MGGSSGCRGGIKMSTISVNCNDHVLSFASTPIISSGDQNVDKIQFDFSSHWNDFAIVCVFYREKGKYFYMIVDDDGIVNIPNELLATDDIIYFGVTGFADNTRRTSTILSYKILDGAYMDVDDPSEDIYAQILDKLAVVDANAILALTNSSTALNSANSALQKVSNLSSATPLGVYSTVSALTSADPDPGIYIVTNDGYTYLWDGTSTTKLTLYQSTGIADSAVTSSKLADKAAIQTVNGLNGNISDHVDANPSGNPASVNTGEWYYNIDTVGVKSNNIVISSGDVIQNQLRTYNGFGTGFDSDINYSGYDHSYTNVPANMTKIGDQKAVVKEITQATSLRYLPMTVSFGSNDYSGKDATIVVEFMLQGLNGDTTNKTGTILNTVQDSSHTYFGNSAQTFKKANVVFEVNKVYRIRFILKNMISNPTSIAHVLMFKNQTTFNIIYSRFSVTIGAYQVADIPLTKKESFNLISTSECVTSDLLGSTSVTTAKLASSAITSAKIEDGAVTSSKLADKAAIQTINGFNGNISDHVDANPSGNPASANTGEWYYDIETADIKSNNVVTSGGNIIHNQLRTYNGFGSGFDNDVSFDQYAHSYIDVPAGMIKIGNQKAVTKEIEQAASMRYLPMTVSFGNNDYSGEDVTITVEFMLQGLNGDTTNKTGIILNTVQDASHTYFGNPAQTFKKASVVFQVNKVYRMRLILKNLVSNPTSISHILTFTNQTTFNIIYSRFSVTKGAHQLSDIPLTKKENAAGLDVDISSLDTRVSNLETRKFEFSELFSKALFAGDSLTVGHYYDNNNTSKGYAVQNYPYYMNKKHGWDILVKAVGGMDAKSWWNSYGSDDYSDCDVCFLWLGTNNGLTDTLDTDVNPYDDPSNYANTNTGKYCRIIEKLKLDNSYMKIFLLKIFSSNSETTNSVIDKIATKYSLDVLDLSDGSVSRTTYPWMHNTHGNIHFTKMGNIGLANVITEKMNKAIQNNATAYEQPVTFQ